MEPTSLLASFSSSLDSIVSLFGTGGDLCRDITNEPVKHGYPIPPTGFLSPLHLSPLHLGPLHLNPLHLNPLHLNPLHLSPLHLHPLHLSPLHLHPLHLRPLHLYLLYLLHLCPLHLHLRPTGGDLRRDIIITDEPVKRAIPRTGFLRPLHLCLHPLHLRPLHLCLLHLHSLHPRPAGGDPCWDITDEPAKRYPILPMSFLLPLHPCLNSPPATPI